MSPRVGFVTADPVPETDRRLAEVLVAAGIDLRVITTDPAPLPPGVLGVPLLGDAPSGGTVVRHAVRGLRITSRAGRTGRHIIRSEAAKGSTLRSRVRRAVIIAPLLDPGWDLLYFPTTALTRQWAPVIGTGVRFVFSLSPEAVDDHVRWVLDQAVGVHFPSVDRLRRAHRAGFPMAKGAVIYPGADPARQGPGGASEPFVSRSTSEADDQAIVDAMASGRPIVALTRPGIREIVSNGLEGLVVEGERDLVAAVDGLRAHPGEATRLGHNARAKARREFSEARWSAAFIRLFESV